MEAPRAAERTKGHPLASKEAWARDEVKDAADVEITRSGSGRGTAPWPGAVQGLAGFWSMSST